MVNLCVCYCSGVCVLQWCVCVSAMTCVCYRNGMCVLPQLCVCDRNVMYYRNDMCVTTNVMCVTAMVNLGWGVVVLDVI